MADEKDFLILDALKENAKASVVQIAKKTGLPSTTVHNRIKKLQEEGTITKYTIKIDNKKIGRGITAYIAIVADYKALKEKKITMHELIRTISNEQFVESISLVTGQIDIIVKASFKSIEELNELVMKKLRNLDGVEKTETMIILDEAMN